jgi:hypothetical protein
MAARSRCTAERPSGPPCSSLHQTWRIESWPLEKQLRDNNDALTDLYERELARERRHILIKG